MRVVGRCRSWTCRRWAAVAVLCLGIFCAFPGASSPGGHRPIAETDLFRFVWIGDPRISPDGSQVVFVRVTADASADRYDTALWIVATSGGEAPKRLTAGPADSGPRWSPDGRHIAFVRPVEKDGKPGPAQVFVLDMDGGEPRQVTDLPRGCGAVAWSPDGRRLAFTSTTTTTDLHQRETSSRAATNRQEPAGGAAEGALPPHESDVRVITKAVYRDNDRGYADPDRRAHLWTLVVPAPDGRRTEPHQVTDGPFDETSPAWSPDGARLYFSSARTLEPYYAGEGSAVYSVPADGGGIVKVAGIAGWLAQPVLSPDGRQVATTGVQRPTPVRSFDQPDLFVAPAETSQPSAKAPQPRNLTATYDFDIGDSVSGDQHAPRGAGSQALAWSADGRTIWTLSAERGRANLQRVDVATGRVTPATRGDHEVVAWSATPDGSKAVVLISTPVSIGDLFVVDLTRQAASAPADARQITHVNEELFSSLDLTAPEEIHYRSFDGRQIEGWILKPPAFDPSKRYPLILEIHGGPHSAYGATFTHEFSWLAAKGYVVLYTNPRGSSTYGQEFGNLIQYHYPGDDYRDLMAGVDAVVARGYIDEKRMGVTGGSGGGVLTNWTVTRTSRFAAAVSQRSIADWSAFWYTTDFAMFQPTWFRGAPWEDPSDFAGRSAITRVSKVTTPLMLVEGEADYRTPPGAGGEMMFRALKYLRKPVVMVRFPGESHELSRSGRPWHRVERLRHIAGWFDRWLMGIPNEIYDVK